MSIAVAKFGLRRSSSYLSCRITNNFASHSHISVNSTILRFTSSDNRENNSQLGSSTILIQDGLVVQELPVIVKKMRDILPVENKIDLNDGGKESTSKPESSHYYLIQEEFKQCYTLRDIFTLLSKCGKVTPSIALGAVERISSLEDLSYSWLPQDTDEKSKDIAKGAIVEKLLNVILKTEDAQTLLNTVNSVPNIEKNFKVKFIDELLSRVSDNKLGIEQLCDFALYLVNDKESPKSKENIEKLWIGFAGKEGEISDKNIVAVFNLLPHLGNSRRLIIGILEKRLHSLWWKLQPPSVQEIMDVICKQKVNSLQLLSVLGRWMNTNIHNLNEDSLLEIITKFTSLNYNDGQIQTALEKYMKAKSVKISTHSLIVAILNHCTLFRLRNGHILNGCCEYFIARGPTLPAMFLKPIIYPFGYLYFHPANGVKFWTTLEKVFDDNFTKLSVEDYLDIMLSCIYLEKYPLNFVSKVFNPHSLNKINQSPNAERLRMKLQLIDTAMSLECPTYEGPLLPKDTWAKSIMYDGRIRRIVNNIRESLEHIAGGYECVSFSVVVPHLFTTELYIVDVLLHPKGLGSSILTLNLKTDRNVNVAILVNLPEHFCSKSEQLVGSQMMRVKHLRLMGMKVVGLKYTTLSRLRMHRKELEQYLVDSLKQALPAL